jgi:transposase
VLEGLRGEESIAELCRREGIVQNLYYRWSKDFLEAGKKRLAGDTARAATSDEVKELRREASALKKVVAELTLENRLLKKACRERNNPGASLVLLDCVVAEGDQPDTLLRLPECP